MVATLHSRKEALEAKIAEKTAELKALCLQEADLTGTLPPETPLEPGEPPPTIRKRVGTSFSFPQSLINNLNSSEDAFGALELECKVQTNISEAALVLANDTNASKAVRRKHRLMYRQSQRNLSELETRLTLLRQGRHQPLKTQQIRKKPRPNTVDHTQLMREMKGQKMNNILSNGSWPMKHGLEEDELRQFSSLNRQRSSGTSQSSNSPRLSARDLPIGLPDQYSMTTSLSQPNIQEIRSSTDREIKRSEKRSSGRRQWDTQSAGGTLLPNQTYPDSHQPNLNRAHSLGSVDGQRGKEKEWYETSLDSAPSPPLRTSSRLPTSVRMQFHLKEMQIRDAVNRSMSSPKPHPVLTRTVRTTSVDEMAAHMQAMHMSTPPVARHHFDNAHDLRHLENYTPPEQTRYYESPVEHRKYEPRALETPQKYEEGPVTPSPSINRMRSQEVYSDNSPYDHRVQYERTAMNNQHQQYATRVNHDAPNFYNSQMQYDVHYAQRQFNSQNTLNRPCEQRSPSKPHLNTHVQYDAQIMHRYDQQIVYRAQKTVQHENLRETMSNSSDSQSLSQYDVRQEAVHNQNSSPHQAERDIAHQKRVQYEPQLARESATPAWVGYNAQNAPLHQEEMKSRNRPHEVARVQYNPDSLTVTERPRFLNVTPQDLRPKNDTVSHLETGSVDIPDEVDSGRRIHEGSKTPTQPYFHTGANPVPWSPTVSGLPEIVPPHAVTQDEITFDTVVPFESPQNHTVVQAGVWQPYREVTKPFEMSDFYKYSTKFRQARQSPANGTPEPARKSPGQPPLQARASDPVGVVGVYQPLRPMTCQPVERRPADLPHHEQLP